MTNGSILHKCMEDFVDFGTDKQSEILETNFSEIFETNEKSLKNLILYYYRLIPLIDKNHEIHTTHRTGEINEDGEIIEEIIINPVFEEKALKSLQSFYEDYTENFYKQSRKGKEPNIILQEEWFNLKLKDGHEIRGLIDRVDEEPDGEHIVDYKSGQSRVTYKALEDPLDVKSMQLSIYALARYKKTGKIPVRASFFYVEPAKGSKNQKGQYRTAQKFNEERLNKVEDFLNDIANEIEKSTINQDFPTGDNPNCYFCDFNKVCDIVAARELKEMQESIQKEKSEYDW